MIEDKRGYVVITPVEFVPPAPLSCELCDHVMRSRDDEASYREFGCCDRCARLWAHPRRKLWVDGWRPSRDQIARAEIDRVPLALVFDVD